MYWGPRGSQGGSLGNPNIWWTWNSQQRMLRRLNKSRRKIKITQSTRNQRDRFKSTSGNDKHYKVVQVMMIKHWSLDLTMKLPRDPLRRETGVGRDIGKSTGLFIFIWLPSGESDSASWLWWYSQVARKSTHVVKEVIWVIQVTMERGEDESRALEGTAF